MESYSKVGVHKDKFTFGGKTPLPPKTNSNTFCVWTEAWCSVKLFLPCASRCSVWGKLGRQTEAGRQRWHQAGSRQWETGGTEAGTPTDGDSGDAAERNRWQLVHRSALQLEFLLLLLHCLPGTTKHTQYEGEEHKYDYLQHAEWQRDPFIYSSLVYTGHKKEMWNYPPAYL